MKNLNKSPERFTFQRDRFLNRQAGEGKTPENNETVKVMAEYFDNTDLDRAIKEADPAWREDNMEYDLRSTEWICDKAKESRVYAQHLYAAMCNREFQRNDMIPILKDQKWSCTWRYAGGIVADMREQGDYIDWYCTGIQSDQEIFHEDFITLTEEQQIYIKETHAYVSESVVTDEIQADLKKLGWLTLDSSDDGV